MPRNPFCLHGYGRIVTGVNDTLVVYDGSSATQFDVVIPAGVYPLGFGAAAPDSSGDDTNYGLSSLLDELVTQIAVAFGTWDFALQTEYNGGTGIAASPTGHIWINNAHVDDEIRWTDGDCNFPPAWLGSRGDADFLFADTNYEDVSDFSSSLAFVSSYSIHRGEPRNQFVSSHLECGDGSEQSFIFDTHRGQRLGVKVRGVPTLDADNGYNSLRRFVETVKMGGARRRFLFFQDLSLLSWNTYDPDGAAAADRLGQRDLRLTEQIPVQWNDPPAVDGYMDLWLKEFIVKEYVA